jgi:hypothetical protein
MDCLGKYKNLRFVGLWEIDGGVEPFTVQWEQNTVQGDKKGIFDLQFATAPRPNYADLWIQNLKQNLGLNKLSIKKIWLSYCSFKLPNSN